MKSFALSVLALAFLVVDYGLPGEWHEYARLACTTLVASLALRGLGRGVLSLFRMD